MTTDKEDSHIAGSYRLNTYVLVPSLPYSSVPADTSEIGKRSFKPQQGCSLGSVTRWSDAKCTRSQPQTARPSHLFHNANPHHKMRKGCAKCRAQVVVFLAMTIRLLGMLSLFVLPPHEVVRGTSNTLLRSWSHTQLVFALSGRTYADVPRV